MSSLYAKVRFVAGSNREIAKQAKHLIHFDMDTTKDFGAAVYIRFSVT